jgi:hypothetical protein
MLPEDGSPEKFRTWLKHRLFVWRCPVCSVQTIPSEEVILHQCGATVWEKKEDGAMHPTYNTFQVRFDGNRLKTYKQTDEGVAPFSRVLKLLDDTGNRQSS